MILIKKVKDTMFGIFYSCEHSEIKRDDSKALREQMGVCKKRTVRGNWNGGEKTQVFLSLRFTAISPSHFSLFFTWVSSVSLPFDHLTLSLYHSVCLWICLLYVCVFQSYCWITHALKISSFSVSLSLSPTFTLSLSHSALSPSLSFSTYLSAL